MNGHAASCLLLLQCLLLAAGCGRGQFGPTKEIEVPSGGRPVLTSAERIEKEHPAAERLRGPVALATFEQPLAEPQPIKSFDAWSEQEAATDALGRIGAAAVPALLQALQNPDKSVRLKAIDVLARMGAGASDAVPQLIGLLDDPDPAIRKAAARTLGHIGPAAKDAVPALMRTLLEAAPQAPPPQ